MSKDTETWMPIYIADYLRDTRSLSPAEHGAYLLLIFEAWTNGGELPGEDARLQRITGMDRKEWRQSRDVVMSYFYKSANSFRHTRIDEELDRAKGLIDQRRAAGKASAEARKRQREGQRNGNERSTGVERDGQRSLNETADLIPSPSSLRSESQSQTSSEPVSAADLKIAVDDWNEAAAFAGWPKVVKLSDKRRPALIARIKEHGIEAWLQAIAKARASPFLSPENGEPPTWFSFDFMLSPTNFLKLIEGNYDRNRTSNQQSTGYGGGFARLATGMGDRDL